MVETLRRALQQDERHTNMLIVERKTVSARRFGQWNMAYAGPSAFIRRQIDRVQNQPSPNNMRLAASRLTDIMLEFIDP